MQEPQEQFERETEDTIDELKDASTESPLSDSDVHVPSNESDSVSASANDEDSSPSDISDLTDKSEPVGVSPTEKLPPSSDESSHIEPSDGPGWYVIHCYSGYENKVRHNLEQRIETMGMKDMIFDVVIPTRRD